MSSFVGPLWWYIVTIGILVTFHEFGHFWVARRCGVKVLRFSVGFGRPLWSRRGRDGTEYQLAMIPLGGYVKMLDEREEDVPAGQAHLAFNRQHVFKRIAIVAAGPLANLLLCVALLWLAFMAGVPELKPVVGVPTGIAAEAGFREGDTLNRVDGKPAQSWNEALAPLALAAIDRRAIEVGVETMSGDAATRLLPLDRLPADFDQEKLLDEMGLVPIQAQDPPLVGRIEADSPAEGKLRVGDRILALDERPVARFGELPALLQEVAAEGEAVRVLLERDGIRQTIAIRPARVEDGGRSLWRLGIGNRSGVANVRYNPLAALAAAAGRTWDMTRDTLGILKRMLSGQASLKNLSGPISIAQAADSQAGIGLATFLSFLAAISLALFVMNLLPIPILDGGHLLYYLIELVSGRPVGERIQIAGQYLGLALLAGLIGLAVYNDLYRHFS
jgi:regulator of sigma E protease